jgi:hypothetical protein
VVALRDQLNLRPDDLQHVRRRERAERRQDLLEQVCREEARQRDHDEQCRKYRQKEVVGKLIGKTKTAVLNDRSP